MSDQSSTSTNRLDFNIFRERLSGLKKSKGILSKDLAADVDITPATVSRYLAGMRDPDLEYVYRLSRYFGVTIDWLLGVADDTQDTLTPDVRHVAELYASASAEDQAVIRTVLRKYENQN